MKARSGFLLILGAASALLAPQTGRAEEASILNGSAAVQAASYRYYTVPVDLGMMNDAAIIGHVQATGGTGNDIEIAVLTESDFLNWKNGHTNRPVYNSGRVTAADVRARITQSGTYYVVLSNTFSAFTPKTVEGSLRLAWTTPPPPPSAVDSPPADTSANPAANLLILFLVAFSAVLMGGYVWWWVTQQEKKRAAQQSEKKAA
jgi:hypothetical protein